MKYFKYLLLSLFFIGCASSERVQQLEDQVNELNSKLSNLADENQGYQSQIDALNKEISDLKNGTVTDVKPDKPKSNPMDGLKANIQCKAVTKKGTQCSRTAQAGSEYCWQHQSYSGQKVSNTKESSSSPTYTGSREIHTGPRGGQYYINSKGKKTYIKKGKR